MLLYGGPQSGHSYKARLFMRLAGIAHRYEVIDIDQPRDQRPAAFRALARHGEVPVLVDGDKAVVQSNAILLYLARRFELFCGEPADFDLMTSWLFWEANRIGFSYPNLRYYLRNGGGAPDLIAWLTARAQLDLDHLDGVLAGRDFITGPLSIVDLACAAYLLYGNDCGFPLDRWPHVRRWLEAIRAQPNFAEPLDVMSVSQ